MKAQQEYESLTERIEAQKEKKMNRFIAALAAVIQESDEEPAKDTSSEEDDEDIVLISLFSLRIKTECELIREGSRDLVEQVKEDIEELVSHVQSFEYESTISEMVRSDAYDLLKSICLEKDWCIIEQNYSWNLAETAAVGIPMEMYSWVRLHICKTLEKTEQLSKCWRLFALTAENVRIQIIKK